MYQKVRSYVLAEHMLKQSDMVIAGVSGGADSICLLFVLLKLKEELGFSITAVHVHHGIRGADADSDEAYVRQVCKEQGVPLEVYHRDAKGYARQHRLTEEEAGREVRREAFADALDKYGGTKIALAHHMNDNAETFILNLCRGTGMKGAGGMAPVSGVWIRPLLCLKRAEVESYLKEYGISYCTDKTNFEDNYTRNKIRNHVIPYLEQEVNSEAVAHMADAMEQFRMLYTYIEEQAHHFSEACIKEKEDGRIVLDSTEYENIPEALRPSVIHRVICRCAGRQKDIEAVHVRQTVELLHKQVGRQIDLPYGVKAARCYEGIEFYKDDGKQREEEKTVIMRQRVIERTPDMTTFPESPYTKWFDYDIIKNTVKLRHREPGDYLTIDKHGGTQKLKQYFINEKIPGKERERIWLVADGHHIMWVVGYRQNQMYQITDQTKTILEIVIDGG